MELESSSLNLEIYTFKHYFLDSSKKKLSLALLLSSKIIYVLSLSWILTNEPTELKGLQFLDSFIDQAVVSKYGYQRL